MGRGKLPLKLVDGEKSRKAAFMKRKNGLRKKISELATLCGIDACAVYFGPDGDKPESWPEDPLPVIQRYMSLSREEREKRRFDPCSILEKNIMKKQHELVQKQRENAQILNLSWENLVKDYSVEELRDLAGLLDWKLDTVNRRVQILKSSVPACSLDPEKSFLSTCSSFPNMGIHGGLLTQGGINRLSSSCNAGTELLEMVNHRVQILKNSVPACSLDPEKSFFSTCSPFPDMGIHGGLPSQGEINRLNISSCNAGTGLLDEEVSKKKMTVSNNFHHQSGLNLWSSVYDSPSSLGFHDLQTQMPSFQQYVFEDLDWAGNWQDGNVDFLDF